MIGEGWGGKRPWWSEGLVFVPHPPQEFPALKGPNRIAQGNALGSDGIKISSAL
jgi:hypothetical protein